MTIAPIKFIALAAFVLAAITFAFTLGSSTAEATIHPIVESVDCASATANANHPLGDVADPPGQTPGGSTHPGVANHSTTSSLRGFLSANGNAWSSHKLDGECGP
jgi:hypothetical protein